MTFLLWLKDNWKMLVGILLLVTVYGLGYKHGAMGVQAEWDKAKIDNINTFAKRYIEATDNIKKLEEQQNENMAIVDQLHADKHALWLRLPKTPCGGLAAASGVPQTGINSPPASWVISTSIPDRAEQALNEFDAVYRAEAYRADSIVEGCRVLNGNP